MSNDCHLENIKSRRISVTYSDFDEILFAVAKWIYDKIHIIKTRIKLNLSQLKFNDLRVHFINMID